MHKNQLEVLRCSALWSAYGDALGFITELTDESGLKWRTKGSSVRSTVPWRRKIGGKYGVEVELPEGCYSDDTQLRLSTSRSIRGDGVFDVEAFAKVEIPVWANYALGGGSGTKAAANNLANQNVNWFSNFFEKKYSRYIDGGGNGAAMRIQPHIWAANDRENIDKILKDVIRNTICTHGHPRAIAGAVFHALSLNFVLKEQEYPGPYEWRQFVNHVKNIPLIIKSDDTLKTFWLPYWQDKTSNSADSLFEDVSKEIVTDMDILEGLFESNRDIKYEDIILSMDLNSASTRGSGTKTSLVSSAIAWFYSNCEPNDLMVSIANALWSDTDTIGTMVGALLGCVVKERPVGVIQDREYIIGEAERLYKISLGDKQPSFDYPDLLDWKIPKSQLDFIGRLDNRLCIAGLGVLQELDGKKYNLRGKNSGFYQWLKLDFGQTILGKLRENPVSLPESSHPRKRQNSNLRESYSDNLRPKMGDLFGERDIMKSGSKNESIEKSGVSLDSLTSDVIKSGFDPEMIGKHFLELAKHGDGIEKGIAYSSILMKAIIARKNHDKNKSSNGGKS